MATVPVSGFGLNVYVRASKTFPQGFNLTQLADDIDPFDIPSVKVAEATMGLNGDLLVSAKPNPIAITVGVVPNSADDKNMQILLEANRAGEGKVSAQDIIDMIVSYPDGSVKTFSGGAITDGIPGNAVASAGRLKSKPYIFAFAKMAVVA